MKRQLYSILLVATFLGCEPVLKSTPSLQNGFAAHTYRDGWGTESKYVVYVPSNYDPKEPCPTILFLHGGGQTGTDGLAAVRGGLAEAIRSRTSDFPFITIFPQSQFGSWTADSKDGQRVMAILEQVRQLYNVDSSRTYLTGYSMGGEGVWSLAAAFPQTFAAIIPICPSENLTVASKLKDIPCWCFQGDADAPNTVASTRRMLLAIKAAGGHPIYHEYPGIEHNCWDITYRNEEIYEWLLLHSRRAEFSETPAPGK